MKIGGLGRQVSLRASRSSARAMSLMSWWAAGLSIRWRWSVRGRYCLVWALCILGTSVAGAMNDEP